MLGWKSITKSGLTAKTVSVSSHGSALGYGCVVHPWNCSCVTMMWICAGLMGWRSIRLSSANDRPSVGRE